MSIPLSLPNDLSALSPLAAELATTIARVASDIALVIDSDGVISSVAEGAAVLSVARQAWVGQRWIDTVSDSTRPKIQKLLDEASAGGTTRRREVNHPAQGGDEVPVTWTAIRLGLDGPVLAVGRDLRTVAAIQQRFVEAQQDIEQQYWSRRQAETRYQRLFQVARDAVLVLDATSLQVLEANTAAAGVLGLDVAALQGRPMPEGLPAAVRAAVTELLLNASATGRAGEIRVRSLDGAGALDISATPFRTGDQQQLLMRARRDETGDGSSPALARMAEFVETTPDAVVITDSAGCVLMANPAFLRLAQQGNELQAKGRALAELLADGRGGDVWAGLIAHASRVGIVRDAALNISAGRVLATAVLLTEGEQTCLGFILRPSSPANAAGHTDVVLQGLTEQLGRVPLAELLAEVNLRAERQLIASALLSTGGQLDVAADLLGLQPQALALRIDHLGLSGQSYPPGGASPPSIN